MSILEYINTVFCEYGDPAGGCKKESNQEENDREEENHQEAAQHKIHTPKDSSQKAAQKSDCKYGRQARRVRRHTRRNCL